MRAKRCAFSARRLKHESARAEPGNRKVAGRGHDGRRPGPFALRPLPDVRWAVLAERVQTGRASEAQAEGVPTTEAAEPGRSRQAVVPAKRNGTSEDGSIQVTASPAGKVKKANTAREVSTRGIARCPRIKIAHQMRAPRGPRLPNPSVSAGGVKAGAPETSRTKLAQANSNATLTGPAGANRAGP